MYEWVCAYVTLSDRNLCEWLWSVMVDDEHVSCKDASLPPLKTAVHFWSCCRNIFSQMVMRPEEVLCHCVHPLKCSGNVWSCKGFSLQRASSWVLPLWHFYQSFLADAIVVFVKLKLLKIDFINWNEAEIK